MKALKKMTLVGAVAALLTLPSLSEAGVRVYVRFGPPALKTVKLVKPARPYRNAFWVSGHWVYKNGRYAYTKGYWVKKRPGYRYVNAKWVKTPKGYYFVPGHWVKK